MVQICMNILCLFDADFLHFTITLRSTHSSVSQSTSNNYKWIFYVCSISIFSASKMAEILMASFKTRANNNLYMWRSEVFQTPLEPCLVISPHTISSIICVLASYCTTIFYLQMPCLDVINLNLKCSWSHLRHIMNKNWSVFSL